MATFTVRYYTDIATHPEAQPCAVLGHNFPTAEEAERAALADLAAMRDAHGATVGFAIREEDGRVAAMGSEGNAPGFAQVRSFSE